MNTDHHATDVFCSDLVFNAVKDARESIIALPNDLKGTAYDILVASLERDLGPPLRYTAGRSHIHRNLRPNPRRFRRN